MNPTVLKVALLVGGVLLVLLVAGAIWWYVRRRRRQATSKFGFRADSQPAADPSRPPLAVKQDETVIKTEKFIRKRGERIAEVLVDYATVKGLKWGVYMARPRSNSCVWWIGDRYPSAPKTVIAAVHVGLGTVHGFRSKVVVLSEASEVDSLARALGRAAKPRATPGRSDGWNMPIAFPGFPLRPGDGIEITVLRTPGADTAD